jgi:magnesium-transporting ATPase (P-type)
MAAREEQVSLLRGSDMPPPQHDGVYRPTTRTDDEETAWAMATPPEGLSSVEAAARLARYGPNMLSEKKRNELLVFLSYFWGPMPVMIWSATLIVALEEARRRTLFSPPCLPSEGWGARV